MQELSGGAPAGNGQAPQRIEAGPGGYDQGNGDSYGEGDRDLKPWQRGPTGAAAPWARGGDDGGRRDDYPPRDGGAAPPWAAGAGRGGDNYGYGQQPGGYGAPPPGPPGGAAPWQQQAPPPPPGGAQSYNGYGGYPGSGYGDAGAGYPAPQNMGAPPGLGGGVGGLGAPPGLGALFQNYASGSAGSPPPPPPPGDVPPPVSSDESGHVGIF